MPFATTRPESASSLTSAAQILGAHLSNPQIRIQLVSAALGQSSDVPWGEDPCVTVIAPILRNLLQVSYLNEQQLAAYLGVSVRTLQKARWQGGGPPYCRPFGAGSRAVRYNLLAIELWLAQHEFRSTSEATLFDRKHKLDAGKK